MRLVQDQIEKKLFEYMEKNYGVSKENLKSLKGFLSKFSLKSYNHDKKLTTIRLDHEEWGEITIHRSPQKSPSAS